MKCHICKKETGRYSYCKFGCSFQSYVFYTCEGECGEKFSRGYCEYYEVIKNIFDILDLLIDEQKKRK